MVKTKYPLYFAAMVVLCLAISLAACSSKKTKVVAEVGDEKIYLEDFENQYLKTVNSIDSAKKTTLEQRKEFLDLLVKFRLKVKDARDRGLLASSDIQNDLNEYKKTFLSTFLVDQKVVEPNIEKLFEMKKYEVRASHILINLPPNATPEDSTKAYQKAQQVIDRLNNGEDFTIVAKEMSEDQTVQQNGGDLYYFTGGMTVPEFEDVVYQMKVGDISKEPIRTQFGLHIVKLTDKKERVESIKASHILIQHKTDSLGNVLDTTEGYNKAQEILTRAKNGEDFGELAKQFSQDPGSAPNGGDLGYFDRRRMVQEFDSAAFSLKENEISDVIKTRFGYHIIKVIDIKEYEPFEKQKEKLKSEFKRSQQFKGEYTKFMEEAREKVEFEIVEDGMNALVMKFDSTKIVSSNNPDSSIMEQDKEIIVATYDGGEIKIRDVVEYMRMNKEFSNNAANRSTLNNIIKGAGETAVLNQLAEEENVENNDEYQKLLREYEDGLLSFKVDQEELWSKIQISDNELMDYYNANKQKYEYKDGDTVKYREFNEVRSEISNILQQEKFKQKEKEYVDALRQKYPVAIKDEVLSEAFIEE
jgi:peptidyl-prolyl cis-trans isomerase SurA